MSRRTRTWAHFALILVVAVLSKTVALAQNQPQPEPVGLRPDAPQYALHGPYWVGTQAFLIEVNDRPLHLTLNLWYPALNPETTPESVTYRFDLKMEPQPELATAVFGHALLEAAPNTAGAPYPLVIFSHGFAVDAAMYAYFTEHLASYGFVIAAPNHAEILYLKTDTTKDLVKATVERPRDVSQVIDFAGRLTAVGGALEGLIDLSKIAVVGHSFGGYTSLAAAGACYNPAGFHYEADIAALAGFDPVPTGLWPSWGDSRVDVVISLAPNTYMFGHRGLAEVTVPAMVMGGTLDANTPYESDTYPAYRFISSQRKVLVAFKNAGHSVFVTDCQAMPSLIDLGFFSMCTDAVWDMDRAHDLVNHFTTAFLLDVLKGDKDAHAALLPEAVNFAGIEYQTTMK